MASEQQQQTAQRDQWWLVGAAGMAVFMASIDMSIVNVALPTIQEHFGSRTSETEWVVLGYLVPLIALALPSGRWLDGVGQRTALVWSLVGFAVASVAAGLAPTITLLVAARVVEGVFGAVLFALVPALAVTAVRGEARGRAMGIITTLGPLGLVTGPPLGGLLIDTLGWPWVFYTNVPVALVVILIGMAQLPAGRPLRLPDRAWVTETVLLTTAVVAVMVGLSLAAGEGLPWLALLLAAVPPLLLWRRLPVSVAVRDLLKARGMSGPHVALATASTAVGLVFFIVPFYLMDVLGTSPSTAGATILAFPLAMAVLGPIGGVLADWWGAQRTALVGAILLAVGLLVLMPLGGSWSTGELALRLAFVGVGSGLFNAPNMSVAMSNAPKHLLATTGASTSVARQLGFALGPALATVVWALSRYAPGGMRGAVAVAALLSLAGVLAIARTPAAPTQA